MAGRRRNSRRERDEREEMDREERRLKVMENKRAGGRARVAPPGHFHTADNRSEQHKSRGNHTREYLEEVYDDLDDPVETYDYDDPY